MTYLGPKRHETGFEIDPGNPCNRDRRPDIRHVIWRPHNAAVHDGHWVNLSSPIPLGKPLVERPEEDDDDNAQREPNQNLSVLAVLAKDLLRPDGSPQNRCGEESVDARACEPELGIGSANASDALHLEVEDAGADDGADKGGDDLGDEGLAGRDLDVVGELEIVAEPNGVRAGYIAK